jgi:phosphoribosylformimino-5-aminoimidazole carboxamide ribonucleotide (ProFAR) isomerase
LRQVIVTSYLFPSGKLSLDRLRSLSEKAGKDRLVIDISCRKRDEGWVVAMNKWQDLTDTQVTRGEYIASCVFVSHRIAERYSGLYTTDM